MEFTIRFTGDQFNALLAHLFPGDGLEAAALVLCGRLHGDDRHVLAAHRIVEIPHAECHRGPGRITWPTRYADALIQEAARRGMGIVKVHSHPGGFESFSSFDDESDVSFFRSVSDFLDDNESHASAVMLPGGRMFGRVITSAGTFEAVRLVSVAGENLLYWYAGVGHNVPAFAQRPAQAFGSGTVDCLRRMRIAVVGCSGTGSPLIEQLVRLGVGRLVLVDPDRVEWRNLNRVFMTTAADANLGRLKVEVLADAIGRIGLATEVVAIGKDLATPQAVRTVAGCDLVFGGMDSVSGRDLLNRLAAFYLLPYIDLGVQLSARAEGGIDQVTGAIHYLQPGRSSLRSRGVYDSEQVRAELLRHADPAEYQRRLREKYIRGVQEDRPAVISVNTLVAAMAANELLARIHHFRYDRNDAYAVQRFTLHEPAVLTEPEWGLGICPILAKEIGRGDTAPLLDRPELSE
ncbi:MAG: ThiF family adenylyltransferase [Verrucomicrobiales bacterium]|nr:ThiF family adenylyltransferase [Verrucomicrobiales bacterium]